MDVIEMAKIKLKIADEHKLSVWSLVEDVIKYTSPNEDSSYNNTTINVNDKTKGLYDSTAILESSKLSKKLVNMIFPPQVQFASLTLNGLGSRQDETLIKEYGDITYSVLKESNLVKESLNYMQNWSTIGTGALRIIETGDVSMPFRIKQLSLANLSFAEDGFGRPNYVFYRNIKYTKDLIKQTWDLNYNEMADGDETTILESVIYEQSVGMEGIYHYIVSTPDFSIILKKEKLDYNPFVVTRYKRFSNGLFWGVGGAMECMSNIVNLNLNRKNIRIAGKKMLTPALLGYGRAETFSKLKVELGKVSHMGENGQNSIVPLNDGSSPNVEMFNLDYDTIAIKQSFYADFMNSVADDSGVRTAYEWQLRNQEFMNVFSPNYEMFEEEGLKPIFMSAFKILTKIKYAGMEAEKINKLKFKPRFRNKLTDNNNFEKIQKLNNYVANIAQNYGVPVMLMTGEVANQIEELGKLHEIGNNNSKSSDEFEDMLKQYIMNLIGQQMSPNNEENSDGGGADEQQ